MNEMRKLPAGVLQEFVVKRAALQFNQVDPDIIDITKTSTALIRWSLDGFYCVLYVQKGYNSNEIRSLKGV